MEMKLLVEIAMNPEVCGMWLGLGKEAGQGKKTGLIILADAFSYWHLV